MTASDSVGARPSISVVVPVYSCCGCLGELCRQLTDVLGPLTSDYEIILVDDRSPDGAWNAIKTLQQQFPQIRGIRLSRNFGQHIAITAGLAHAKCDLVVVMDCDLQDPPSMIPDLLNKLNEGYDMVLARRIERNHSTFRQTTSDLYFRGLSWLTARPVDGRFGTFSILTRKVVSAFLRFEEPGRHYLFILRYIGFHVGTIDYIHASRLSGRSSYSMIRLLRHAIDGILFQSTDFLIWIIACGLSFAAAGLLSAAYLCYRYFVYGSLEGWTSTAVLILVCSGTVLCSVGVIGLYIGKIFDQTKNRPLYLVDEVICEQPTLIPNDEGE